MTSSFKTIISITVLVLASVTAFSALAQTFTAPATAASGARGQGKAMKAIDTNQDKQISRDEAKGKPKLEKHFDAIDANKDGQLSRAEMKAYRNAHKGEYKGQGKSQLKS